LSALLAKQQTDEILEPTTLGGTARVLALAREGATLTGLVRALAATERPRAVLVDPPPPVAWLDAIRTSGSEVWLVLWREPDDELTAWLVAHGDRARVLVGLIPGSERLSGMLDVLARLKQQGVRTQASVEALLPGVTDARAALDGTLAVLSGLEVGRVSMGYLPLDSRTEGWLQGKLGDEAVTVLAQYRDGPRVRLPGRGPVQLLPRERRQRGYASLLTLAASHGLAFAVSPLTNPDFDRPRERSETSSARPRLTDAYLAIVRAP